MDVYLINTLYAGDRHDSRFEQQKREEETAISEHMMRRSDHRRILFTP